MISIFVNKKGILLYIVIATIVIVIILGNIIMNIMLNQGRLTTHQLNRIQAYYAAMAGINLAYERLRNGNDANWPRPEILFNKSYTRCICRNASCTCPNGGSSVVDPAFSPSINFVAITVTDVSATVPPAPMYCSPSAPGITTCIASSVNYIYTP
jgi:Tfp pilus assembly protein PilX